MESVTLTDVVLDEKKTEVIIKELRIQDPQLYNYLITLDEDGMKEFIERAICVGSVVLQMMDTTSRVDYVRSEFDRIKDEFCRELEKFLSEEGVMSSKLQEFLGEKGELRRALDSHFGEDGSVIYKILNPTDETTPLGKFMKQLQKELDANQEGTAFFELKKCVEEGFEKISREFAYAEGMAEEREKGTAKGADFQEYVYETLDIMARDFEDTVEFVGNESGPLGKVGDIVIHLNTRDTRGMDQRIVIEVKNTTIKISGKKSFLEELDTAKENRVSHYAIGAVHESKIPDAVGALRRFDGSKIICSVPDDDYPLSLEVAYKVARGELICALQREELEIDPAVLLEKLSDIKGQLDKMRAVKLALTGAKGKIDEAKGQLEAMEDAIKEKLSELINMIKAGEE